MTEKELKKFNRGNEIKSSITYYESILVSFEDDYGLDKPCKIIIEPIHELNYGKFAITAEMMTLLPNTQSDTKEINSLITALIALIIKRLKREFKKL